MKFFLLDFTEPKKMVASFIFVFALFAFLWEIISAFRTTEPVQIAIQPTKMTPQKNELNASSALFVTALFGDYVPANLSEAEIKQSMLDVQVVGIMYSGNENESQVIIRSNNGEEKYYVVGDTLPGGAVIKHISAQNVVVLHNGSLESLSLPKNELLFDSPAKPLIGE
ncbi:MULTISPECIES: type II secretion system protein N [Legionella]|nr:type II secretion system protein N [Legionella maceachernii]